MATTESLNDIVSRIVLQHNMVDEDQLDEALALQREITGEGGSKKPSLERVLLDMGIIKGKQLKGLRYAIIYYLVRKADRFYAKIAVQSDICEPKWINEALREQKRVHLKERRLVRINKILLEKGYINAREDRAILRSIEGLREQRKKRKDDGGAPARGKGKKAAASGSDISLSDSGEEETRHDAVKRKRGGAGKAPAGLSDEELQDLQDLQDLPLDELSRNEVDAAVGVKDDDPRSLEELEALSGIGDGAAEDDIRVDDTAEVEQNELLSSASSVGELGEAEGDDEPEEDLGDDLAADEAARAAGSGSEPGDEDEDEDELADEDEDEDEELGDIDLGEDEPAAEDESTFESQDDDLGDLDEEEPAPARASGKAAAKAAPAGKKAAPASKKADDEDEPVVGGPAESSEELEDEDEDEDEDDLGELDDVDDLDDVDEELEDEPPAKKPPSKKPAGKAPSAEADEDEAEADESEAEDDEADESEAEDEDEAEDDEADESEAEDDEAEADEDAADGKKASGKKAASGSGKAAPAEEPKRKGGLFSFFRRDKSPPAAKPRPSGGKKGPAAGSAKAEKVSAKADKPGDEGEGGAKKSGTGKKVDTARLAEMAKKSRAKRLGR